MANRFWVGGTDNWDNTIGLKWALTSGGIGALPVPTASDDVFFDANSGSGTCTNLTGGGVCRSIDFTGYTGTFAGTNALTAGTGSSGNVKFSNTMTLSWTGTTTLVSTTTGNQLTTAGQTLSFVTLNGVGGGWTLQDNLAMSSGSTLTLSKGTLDLNGKTVTCDNFSGSSANTRVLTATNATINLTGTGTAWTTSNSTGLTLSMSGSTINITDTSSTAKNFIPGSSLTYGVLTLPGGTGRVRIEGSNTYGAITMPVGRGLVRFDASATNTITTPPTWLGTSGNLITIDTTTAGTAATISVASGTVSCNFLSLKDSTASGSTPFYAGANSTNVSGNTNWNFTGPPGAAIFRRTLSSMGTSTGSRQIMGN